MTSPNINVRNLFLKAAPIFIGLFVGEFAALILFGVKFPNETVGVIFSYVLLFGNVFATRLALRKIGARVLVQPVNSETKSEGSA